MGAFNSLQLNDGRPDVQFKFGERWQHVYRIGDVIVFGKEQGRADGKYKIAGSRFVGEMYEYFALTIENGKILSADRVSEEEYETLSLK